MSRGPGRAIPLFVLLLSCAGAAPKAPAPAQVAPAPSGIVRAAGQPAEPALPKLRTGTLTPVEHPEPLALELVTYGNDGDFDLIELRLVTLDPAVWWRDAWIHLPSAVLAFVHPTALQGAAAGPPSLWIRRPKAQRAEPITGELFTAPNQGYSRSERLPGHHYRFTASAPATRPDPQISARFRATLADELRERPGAFFESAAERLAPRKPTPVRRRAQGSDWETTTLFRSLMGTTTGRSALEGALASQRKLALTAAREPRTVPIAQLEPPRLPHADYALLLAKLAKPVPHEALAELVPADFYYLRAKSLLGFLELLDLVEDFGQPAADALDGQPTERGTATRYTTALGLQRTELARVLGPEVIAGVALTGSDPYVHDGSDVTLLFQVKSQTLFEAALAAARERYRTLYGEIATSSADFQGVRITSSHSGDRRVRQERARIGNVELVSNSPAAIRRVIAAALDRAPRLSSQPDIRYLLTRDAGVPDEILVLMSDAFVQSAVGPRQKVAQARRLLARGELSAVAHSALLYGLLFGKSPSTVADLTRSRLLSAAELRHAEGGAIDFEPGRSPHSRFGSVEGLEPLIDAAPIQTTSKTERDAYQGFASEYASYWSDYVDPLSIRLSRSGKDKSTLRSFFRALPVLRNANRELIEMVGSSRIQTSVLGSGAHAVLGLGKEASLRQSLSRLTSVVGQPIEFDWLGDYVTLGVVDHSDLAVAARAELANEELELPPAAEEPGSDEMPSEMLALRHVYATVALRSQAGAALALGALKKMLDDTAPGVFKFSTLTAHRGISPVEIRVEERRFGQKAINAYYALCPDAWVVAFRRDVLERLIDAQLDGRAPRSVSGQQPGSQLVVELNTAPERALRTLITWALAAGLRTGAREGRAQAEALLRGAPETGRDPDRYRAMAVAYFGRVPLTPNGKPYELSVSGVRDPDHGTVHAPIFPALPVPGSPLERAVRQLLSVRSEVAFDTELATSPGSAPTPQSFRSDFTLELGKVPAQAK